ncbi:hypothetical protein ACH5RR_036092 [Cinchona calisaya]|uniref:Uncharacterized protein n=1 Tax=Cinchona calisaya TaxID=153742 RepID=A0ABD2Y2D5_9GENT
MKISHTLLYLILCLSIFFLLFHEFYGLKNIKKNKNNYTSQLSSSLSHHQPLIIHRKALAGSKFDFTPFVKNLHRKRKHSPDIHPPPGEPGGNEIDPPYGEEKRLVPTGPNPLHH